MAQLAPDNPFATRWTRPGALEFIFPSGRSSTSLVEKLRGLDWWGEIVGPHGVGKSTLLATLLKDLRRAGCQPKLVTLHDGQRRLPRELAADWTPQTQVVVDGFEQLSWLSRRRLIHRCRQTGCGLLITAHRSVGFPPLITLAPTEETAVLVAIALQQRGVSRQATTTVNPVEVAAVFRTHGGNIREMLFDLYDRYEARKPHDL